MFIESVRGHLRPWTHAGLIATSALAVACGGVSPEDVVDQTATPVEVEARQNGGGNGTGGGNGDGTGGGNGGGNGSGTVPVTADDALAFFDGDVKPLLTAKCALCHVGATAAGGAFLGDDESTFYDALIGDAAYVGEDASQSLLLTYGDHAGPLSFFDGTESEVVLDWLEMESQLRFAEPAPSEPVEEPAPEEPAPEEPAPEEPAPEEPAPEPALPDPLVIEAEEMNLDGYIIDPADPTVIRLPNEELTGTASFIWDDAGTYEISVLIMIEQDGEPVAGLRLNDELLQTIYYPLSPEGRDLLETEPVTVDLEAGDVLEIRGIANQGAYARLDALILQPLPEPEAL